MRHIGPYKIANENYNYVLPMTEDNLILVKDVDNAHDDNDPTYITTYFDENTNGEWFPKPYLFHCELCGHTSGYDRVEYHDNLQDDLEYCMVWDDTNPEVTNSNKRR